MSLVEQFREVFAGTVEWLRREPWMLCWPVLLVWYVTHTPEERSAHIRAVMNADGR